VARGWRRLHNEALHNLYSSHTKFWSANQKVRNYPEDLGLDRRIILEWVLEKYGGKLWTGFISLRIGTGGGLLLTL